MGKIWIAIAAIVLTHSAAAQSCFEWTPATFRGSDSPGIAFDGIRNELVLFGGSIFYPGYGVTLSDTWAFRDSSWYLRSRTGPSARSHPAMVFIPTTRRTLLFGGGNQLQDTWEWDGHVWSQYFGSAPNGSSTPAAVWDSRRSVAVLYTGQNTFEWNGSSWLFRGGSSPGARTGFCMSFDSRRGITTIFGGGSTNDTWEYNGTIWTRVATSGPPNRSNAAMAYSPILDRTVLAGGGGQLTDSWIWNGTAWSQAANLPDDSQSAVMIFDPSLQKLCLFGGDNGCPQEPTDPLVFNGTSWARLNSLPLNRSSAASCYDFDRQVGVLAIGQVNRLDSCGGSSAAYDTWEWSGGRWNLMAPTSLPWRDGAVMAYDPVGHQALLYGGTIPTGYAMETWSWNGIGWSNLQSSAPGGRQYQAMATDTRRNVVVLFGGLYSNATDTWEWNGSIWQRKATAGPPPRGACAAAFDESRGVTVLYGGFGPGGAYNDTWEWDGISWVQRSAAGPTLYQTAMSYDPRFQACILVAGGNGVGSVNQSYKWNGQTWTQLQIPAISPRTDHSLFFDESRQELIATSGLYSQSFGGDGYPYLGDTWRLRATGPEIQRQPASQTRAVHKDARFEADTFSSSTPTLQWRKNGQQLGDDSHITGSTSNVLTIHDLDGTDAGEYDLVITNGCGTATTSLATLTITAACLGDINQNGSIELGDLATLLADFGHTGTDPADLDGNQVVDIGDLALLLSKFGDVCPPP